MAKLNELKEQLNRCQLWLVEEPNDEEVQQKVVELQTQINAIENEQATLAKQADMEARKNYLLELHNSIQKLQRELKTKPVIIRGFEKQCMAMEAIHKNAIEVQLDAKVQEFNTLAKEYEKLLKEVG